MEINGNKFVVYTEVFHIKVKNETTLVVKQGWFLFLKGGFLT
jgi:hypothetical protein